MKRKGGGRPACPSIRERDVLHSTIICRIPDGEKKKKGGRYTAMKKSGPMTQGFL